MTIGIVWDTETTGLWNNRSKALNKQPWTVELYALKFIVETGEEIGSFGSWFKPGVKLEKEAAKVTGLTDEFLSDKPMFSEKIDEIDEFFSDGEWEIGQNLMFDIQMREFDYQRCGKTYDLSKKKLFDTVEATEYINGFRSNLTLLHELLFGEGFKGAHGAESDVRATKRVFMELYNKGDI